MAYSTSTAPGKVAQKNGSNGATIWVYKSADSLATVAAADYFSNGYDLGMEVGDLVIVINSGTGGVSIQPVVAVTVDGAASIGGATLDLDTAGANVVPPGVTKLTISQASQVTATIADASLHPGLFIVTQTGTGTAGHTVTLTAGTFDGTNNVATLNAQAESLAVWFDSDGNGTILENTGGVGLS